MRERQRSGPLRLIALVVGMIVLAGCRMDIALDVAVAPDGTGTITVVTTVDADVVGRVPTIADELVLDDVVAAGWIVDGPTATPEGGLSLTLSHGFESAREATNLLRSLGGPFNAMEVQRTENNDEVITQVAGRLGLTDGFETFADAELLALVGGFPFADEIAASGATPETSIGITVRALLPGAILDEATNGTRADDGALDWTVPTDGMILQWRAAARQAPGEGAAWARPLSIAAVVALVAWVAFMTVLIGVVVVARWRRARRYRRRPRPSTS